MEEDLQITSGERKLRHTLQDQSHTGYEGPQRWGLGRSHSHLLHSPVPLKQHLQAGLSDSGLVSPTGPWASTVFVFPTSHVCLVK